MSNVTAEDIKKIRERTGASLAMIRKALEEANGDEKRALEVLKKLGHEAAEKKSVREVNAGRIEAYVHSGARVGVIVEIRSETDFVARNEEFGEMAHNVAMHIAAMGPGSVEELLQQPYIKEPAETIDDLVKKASAQFGERIEIQRFERYSL